MNTNPKAKGSYMGFSRLGLAIGGFIGYSGAGWLHDIAINLNLPTLPWFALTLIGFFTIIYLNLLFKQPVLVEKTHLTQQPNKIDKISL